MVAGTAQLRMAKKLAFERYHWFYGQIKSGRFPNARKLAGQFEISEKQAQRDIEFMRDRLKAPLQYVPEDKGYFLRDAAHELPPLWFGEEELQALCLSLRLASPVPDERFKKSLHGLLEKFLDFRCLDSAPSLGEIARKVSVKNIEYYRVKESVFHAVAEALFKDLPITIEYFTPHKHESSRRTIVPLHLLCYMGRWHLIAYCTLKKGLRDFALSRIRDLEILGRTVRVPKNLPPIKEYVHRNFGLMNGRKSFDVRLRFKQKISSWIAEQVWSSRQEMTRQGDGSIDLRFPAADLREVLGEILKYGADVEAVAPPELRRAVAAEIKRMGRTYRRGEVSPETR